MKSFNMNFGVLVHVTHHVPYITCTYKYILMNNLKAKQMSTLELHLVLNAAHTWFKYRLWRNESTWE